MSEIVNPLEPTQSLKRLLNGEGLQRAYLPEQALGEDSAATKAEQVESDSLKSADQFDLGASVPSLQQKKRVKLDGDKTDEQQNELHSLKKVKGVALVKKEYLIERPRTRTSDPATISILKDDDADRQHPVDDRDRNHNEGKKNKKKSKGQNTARQYVFSKDAISLCHSRANSAEFSPKECRFGDRCNLCHDLRKYLREGRKEDLTTLSGKCPVWEANGKCYAGWKCRFLSSHMQEIDTKDGQKELVLIADSARVASVEIDDDEIRAGIVNIISSQGRHDLSKRRTKTDKADKYAEWLEGDSKELFKIYHKKKVHSAEHAQVDKDHMDVDRDNTKDNRAQYMEPPFRPAEKRKVYFGSETPILAPLTTQGNLPFRRLCVELGAQLTYSEMAMALPLLQGQRSEWALMRAHQTEMLPPQFLPKAGSIIQEYENSKDFKFGAQISANKPAAAIKTTEILTNLMPHLRVIDLNCGCPLELVCRVGAGSALLDNPSKIEKMIRGMNALSGEVPITAKIRMGTRDGKPTSYKLVERLALGSEEIRDRLGPPGCAAITLHGRSKQQRYTRNADWGYIAECAALIKSFYDKKDALTDTANDPDPRQLPNGQKMYFIGNGDCYSHVDYADHINNSGVDAVMVARGALIKPWLFEEIEKGQYLDKSASERLTYVEKFSRYGLEVWGSDEYGVGQTRRFLLEWLSFAHRYVPVGILEHLPPSLQDRPPAYRGRNDMETLLASDNYKDWIKISEMFLGPAGADFQFQPKHKSNSYEIEAEG